MTQSVIEGCNHKHIYIIRTREFFTQDMPIYKVGRSSHMQRRMSQYPKGSELVMCARVDDEVLAEKELIAEFAAHFQARPDIGAEYFYGDVNHMMDIFFTCTKRHNGGTTRSLEVDSPPSEESSSPTPATEQSCDAIREFVHEFMTRDLKSNVPLIVIYNRMNELNKLGGCGIQSLKSKLVPILGKTSDQIVVNGVRKRNVFRGWRITDGHATDNVLPS